MVVYDAVRSFLLFVLKGFSYMPGVLSLSEVSIIKQVPGFSGVTRVGGVEILFMYKELCVCECCRFFTSFWGVLQAGMKAVFLFVM